MLTREQIEGWEELNWDIYKQANEFYWAVKGQLIPLRWSSKDIIAIYHGYMARIWGNHEAMTTDKMKGFEEAWNERVEYCSNDCWDGDTFEKEEEWPDFVDNMDFG